METCKYRNLLGKLFDMTLFRIMQQTIRGMFSSGVMVDKLGCNWFLLSSQNFKRSFIAILDITSFDWFYLNIPKELEKYLIPHFPILGVGLQSLNWSNQIICPYSQLFFSFLRRVCLIGFLIIILFLFWILSLCISVASLWYSFSFGSFDINFHMIFLSWWVDWILSNRSSWMQKYSWSDKVPSSFSGIPIKVHPSVLSNCNCSWSMINIFSDIHHIELDYHILQETWLFILGSWY